MKNRFHVEIRKIEQAISLDLFLLDYGVTKNMDRPVKWARGYEKVKKNATICVEFVWVDIDEETGKVKLYFDAAYRKVKEYKSNKLSYNAFLSLLETLKPISEIDTRNKT